MRMTLYVHELIPSLLWKSIATPLLSTLMLKMLGSLALDHLGCKDKYHRSVALLVSTDASLGVGVLIHVPNSYSTSDYMRLL